MMTRFVKTVFFLMLASLLAVLIVPSFIDWNRHKDKIVGQISLYLQRTVDVAGNVSLQILPQPEVMLEKVAVANAAGAKSGPLLTLNRLGIRIKFSSLLEGRIEVESLDLVDPVLNLEIMSGGKPGWTGAASAPEALGGALQSVQLNRVRITNGTLNYTNQETTSHVRMENLNLAIEAGSLWGPYNIQGDMKYRNIPVKMDIAIEQYKGASAVPLRVALIPLSGLPQVKFNGVMDVQTGIALQGEMSVEQGNLASLLDMDAVNGLAFMQESADLRGVLELKGDQFSINDIKAKFGQKGDMQGKLSVQFPRNSKPVVRLVVEGNNLVVTDKTGDVYLSVPASFTGSFQGKGKNITWGGYKLPAADMTADFDSKGWKIRSAAVDLPGGSQLKLSGLMSPSSDSGSYTIQLATVDLGKMVSYLAPGDNSIFKYFSDTGLIRKLTMTSSLEVSPARISFFNMDAAIEEKMKLSGVVNIDRLAPKPNAVARINAVDWDVSALPAEAYAGFWQKIMQTDADIELSSKNFTKGDLRIPELSLKGKIGEQGIDFIYALKTDKTGDAATLLPPPLRTWNALDLKGQIKGNAQKYSFTAAGTAEGGDVVLSGDDEGDAYRVEAKVKHPDAGYALGLLGLPVEGLVGEGGGLDFAGELRGIGDTYKIDRIQAQVGTSSVSGTLEKKDGKYTADLNAKKLNLDQWLSGDWPVKQDISFRLQGGELVWHGQHMTDPQLTVDATASAVNIPNMAGTVWGGKLSGTAALTRKENAWGASFQGSLKQADLNALTAQLGLKGFSAGAGDIDFNLTAPENAPGAASGQLDVRAGTVTIEKFNFEKLGEMISGFNQVPATLQTIVNDNVHKNGGMTFKDVQGRFNLDKGKIDIESLKLPHAQGDMTVTGSADVKAGNYKVTGSIALRQPAGVPALTVQCTAGAPDCAVDSEPLREYILKSNPLPVAVHPDVAPVPAPATALPPVQEENKSAVTDILKRLDEEDAAPAPPKPAPPKPDVTKEIQKKMMQEMMQQEGGFAP